MRKECDNLTHSRRRRDSLIGGAAKIIFAFPIGAACLGPAPHARAGSVQLWPGAVVVQDTVTLSDLCELRGFEPQTERKLATLTVASSPPPGGRRVIHLQMIREALSAAGINLASTTLRGATQCTVSRPSAPDLPTPSIPEPRGFGPRESLAIVRHGGRTLPAAASSNGQIERAAHTLRAHIIDWFNARLSRYGGRAEIEFGKGSAGVLDLTSPPYEFSLRRKSRAEVGLVHLEVDIKADDEVRQTAGVICNVSFFAPVIVPRRPINRSMTIRETDVQVTEMKFTSLDRLSVSDTSLVVGRRAKRFVPVGEVIRSRDLETVPLVTRNQLVRLLAAVGGVRIETAGKAVGSGGMGDVITVRSLDDRRREFEAVITGPGEATVGTPRDSFFASNRSERG